MITEQRKPEWLDLKSAQLYARVSSRTLREWIQRPVNPLPVMQGEVKTVIRRRTFDQWLETYHPLIARMSSHFRKMSPSVWSASPWLNKDSAVCDDGIKWLANFASPADAWDSCNRGDWMLWLLEHINPLTEEQWEELEQALKPFWVKRHAAQSPAETRRAMAEFELGKANALREIIGNPWRSQT